MRPASSIAIGPARTDDLTQVVALLARHHLPEAGLAAHADTLIVARDAHRVVGSAALELYGAVALLRSVVVDDARRGTGLGQRLTAAALDLARARGVRTVYLLTETAAGFFPRFGFAPIARDAVAPAIRGSVEFTTACPDSATAMALTIAD